MRAVVLAAVVAILVACSGEDDDGGVTSAPEPNTTGLTAIPSADACPTVVRPVGVAPTPAPDATYETPTAGPTPECEARPDEVWSVDLGSVPNDYRYVVVAADERVVVAASAPQYPQLEGGPRFVAGFDPDTGTERWREEFDCAPFQPVIVHEAVVFACADGVIRSLATSDGALRWETDTGTAPFMAVPADDLLLFGDGDPEHYWLDGVDGARWVAGTVVALDGATGAEVWRVETGSELAMVATMGNTSFIWTSVRTAGGGGSVIAVDAATGTQRWKVDGAGEMGQPGAGAEGVYAMLGRSLVALDPDTGATSWAADASYWAAVWTGDVVIVNANSLIGALAADTGEVLWEQGYCDCPFHAQAAGGAVVISGGQGFGAVDPRTGTLLWDAGADQFYPPAIAGSRVYAGTRFGKLTAYE